MCVMVSRLGVACNGVSSCCRCVVDMDAFFVSVAIRDSPSLAQKAVAVGGMGMISTANYIARQYGVRSAMPGFIAVKLCPDLVFVKHDGEAYAVAAAAAREVFAYYDPDFSSMSQDEASLDLTDFCARFAYGEAELFDVSTAAAAVPSAAGTVPCAAASSPSVPARIDGAEGGGGRGGRCTDDRQALHGAPDDGAPPAAAGDDSDEDELTDAALMGDDTVTWVEERRVVGQCDEAGDAAPQPDVRSGRGAATERAAVEPNAAAWECVPQVVAAIRAQVHALTRLTCSAGVAVNRMLAKIASNVRKPNGQFIVGPPTRVGVLAFVSPLTVRSIPGVGKVTEKVLGELGVKTCGEAVERRVELSRALTPGAFSWILRACLGDADTRRAPPEARDGRKSISTERTFRAMSGRDALAAKLREICDRLASAAKDEGLRGHSVTLKVKSTKFDVVTRTSTVAKCVRARGAAPRARASSAAAAAAQAREHGGRVLRPLPPCARGAAPHRVPPDGREVAQSRRACAGARAGAACTNPCAGGRRRCAEHGADRGRDGQVPEASRRAGRRDPRASGRRVCGGCGR